MNLARLQQITCNYARLRIAIVGDFCLDRYLEIDPARAEISIETSLTVHNVTNVRSQPGGAGTILNNLSALGVVEIYPVGFCGVDGEGFELLRALAQRAGVRLDHFHQTPERRTFTYTKPLVVEADKPPVELNRLDFKNWSPTPPTVEEQLIASARALADTADAFILLDQVDVADTGVVTRNVLRAIDELAKSAKAPLILADSRRGLAEFPPVVFKMNRAELGVLAKQTVPLSLDGVKAEATRLAARNGQRVFVTLSEAGIVGAEPDGRVEHVPALPVRGPIDIVGAGDAVTANLTAALSAGATLREALQLAMAASSIVIHQLGTTGTASVEQLLAVSSGVAHHG